MSGTIGSFNSQSKYFFEMTEKPGFIHEYCCHNYGLYTLQELHYHIDSNSPPIRFLENEIE